MSVIPENPQVTFLRELWEETGGWNGNDREKALTIYEWLKARASAGDFGADLRVKPYKLSNRNLGDAIETGKDTVEKAFWRLETRQEADVVNDGTRLVGPPRFMVWIEKDNVGDRLTGAVKVSMRQDQHWALLRDDQFEVCKLFLEFDKPEERGWLEEMPGPYDVPEPVVGFHRLIFLLLKGVVYDAEGRPIDEWALPLGLHHVLLDGRMARSASNDADLHDVHAERDLRRLVGAMKPSDSLRELMDEMCRIKVTDHDVFFDACHPTPRDTQLLKRFVTTPNKLLNERDHLEVEPVCINEKVFMVSQYGYYFGTASLTPVEITREIYFRGYVRPHFSPHSGVPVPVQSRGCRDAARPANG